MRGADPSSSLTVIVVPGRRGAEGRPKVVAGWGELALSYVAVWVGESDSESQSQPECEIAPDLLSQ